MRFFVEVDLEHDRIEKDKNRAILSLLKHCLSEYDAQLFESLYSEGKKEPKDFTFFVSMPKCKFLKEEIEIPNKKIYIYFSSYDMPLTIALLNSFMEKIGGKYEYKGNIYYIRKVKMLPEKKVESDRAVFRSMSPCVAREHHGDNKKTCYHSLNDEAGVGVFFENLKVQARLKFPDKQKDIDALQIKVLQNKEVKVKYYDIVILSNLATFELTGKNYLLEYFYQSGASSLKSAGFGMLDIV